MATALQDAWIEKILNVPIHARPGGAAAPGNLATTPAPPGGIGDWREKRRVKKLAKAAQENPGPVLSDHQSAVCDKKLAALSGPDQDKFKKLLAASAMTERAQLKKALASGHSVAKVEEFAAKIKGKDSQWMDANLRVAARTDGTGIRQQWVMSCPATAVQAVRGTLDPIYALSLNEAGDIAGLHGDMTGAMAAEQKQLLETPDQTGHAGRAVKLSGFTGGDAGVGRFNDDLLNNVSSVTNIKYTPTAVDQNTMDAHTTKIAERLRDGLPVPLVVGGGPGETLHYVVATRVIEREGKKGDLFEIHDVGSGQTVYRTAEDFRKGKLDLPSGWTHLTQFEDPVSI